MQIATEVLFPVAMPLLLSLLELKIEQEKDKTFKQGDRAFHHFHKAQHASEQYIHMCWC